MDSALEFLREVFDAAVAAVQPARCVPPHLPQPPSGRTIVVGAGKAAAAMARAVEDTWDHPLEGLVITPHGHGVACERIEVVEAAHPVPSDEGREASRRILDLVRDLDAEDLVLCLLSGGGSALLTCPPAWLPFEEKQRITEDLLRSGAPIQEINCVRGHLSEVKGGRLAVACHPARLVTLLISDVPGDDPAVVASGPTMPRTSGLAADEVLRRCGIELSAELRARVVANTPPEPGDPRFARNEHVVIARSADALAAASACAARHGVEVVSLGDRVVGEAQVVGEDHAALVRVRDASRPSVVLSGGETTVTVRGSGRGGRNTEYLLAFAAALGQPGVYALACDTDGIDGSEDNAGAVLTPTSLERAAALGCDPQHFLARNDAYSFFAALGDLVVTGPTLTNVNDLRAVLLGWPS